MCESGRFVVHCTVRSAAVQAEVQCRDSLVQNSSEAPLTKVSDLMRAQKLVLILTIVCEEKSAGVDYRPSRKAQGA